MKYTSILFLLFVFLNSYSQAEIKTLQVKAYGTMSVNPDIGMLYVELDHIDENFSSSIIGLNQQVQNLSSQLISIGYEESAIKTTKFNVRKNQIYRNNKSIDSGYIASQRFQLRFKNNENNIAKILNEFSSGKQDLNLNFDFKLSDTLEAKVHKKVIKLATADALSKAKLITEETGQELDGIKTIKFGMLNNKNNVTTINIKGYNSLSKGFTTKEIVLSETILITWNLK